MLNTVEITQTKIIINLGTVDGEPAVRLLKFYYYILILWQHNIILSTASFQQFSNIILKTLFSCHWAKGPRTDAGRIIHMDMVGKRGLLIAEDLVQCLQ